MPRLHAAGFEITALLRSPNKRHLIEPYVTTIVQGDLNSEAALIKATQNVDTVIHLASSLHQPWDQDLHAANIQGTAHVARACGMAPTQPHLIIVSSLAARGPTKANEETAPISAYGRAKRAAEDVALSTYNDHSISIVRPPMVIGPFDPSTRPIFEAIRKGFVPINTADNAIFSLVDVRDLAEGLVRMAKASPFGGGSPIYFAFNEQLRMEDLAARIKIKHNVRYRLIPFPKWLLWTVACCAEFSARIFGQTSTLNFDKYREMSNGPWTCAADLARRRLGWHPMASLNDRLSQVFSSYVEHDQDQS